MYIFTFSGFLSGYSEHIMKKDYLCSANKNKKRQNDYE